MHHQLKISLHLSVVLILLITNIHTQTQTQNQPSVISNQILTKRIHNPSQTHPRGRKRSFVKFSYKQKPLINIIHELSAQKNVNIILPTGNNTIKAKISIDLGYISLQEAWNVLYTLLDMAGYSLIEDQSLSRKENFFSIIKTSPTIAGEPLPLFIGTPPNELANNDERIKYIYYFSNMQMDESPKNEITDILNIILPKSAKNFTDPATNSLIIIGKVSDVKAAMEIIISLDQTKFKEKLEFLHLNYVSAEMVASLFEDILKSNTPTNRFRLDARKKRDHQYFSRHLKIIPVYRSNSLVILGKSAAVEQVVNFIRRYIDVELESGRSILHIYNLQYLEADKFAQVLQRVVNSDNSESGQSAGSSASQGSERFFKGVIVKADVTSSESGGEQYKHYGGNKLIIAASSEDWVRIRKLIEQLDTPQPQVIIEVLIADLNLDDTRLLGSIVRNPLEMPLPGQLNAQSAQITDVIAANTSPPGLQEDLLKTDPFGPEGPANLAVSLPPGSTLISFNDKIDGRTWGMLQLLNLFGDQKIVLNPHVIATNNKEAVISIGQERLLPDQASGSEGGTTQVNRKWVTANLVVKITPRISSADTVNLTVEVKIDRFQDPATSTIGVDQSENNIDSREVRTNANVGNQDILVIGGLTRIDREDSIRGTPIWKRIPILKWFGSRRSHSSRKTSLAIIISPTIIQARLRGGASEYTQNYVAATKKLLEEGYLFETLKDPITRFFFRTNNTDDPVEVIDRFTQQDELISHEIL